MKLSAIILLAALIGLSGCGRPKMADVAGEYVGHYGGATERLILRPDGTLWQELRKGIEVIYTNEGTWKIGRAHEDLDFDNFYVALKLHDLQMVTNAANLILSPDRVTGAEVLAASNFRFLTLAPDTLYFFERVADPAASAAKK